MKITQLRYFCEVCRTNNISKAAENLFVSQSAISISIRELESEFDTSLFIRNNNRLTLTEAGKKLWDCAEKILNMVEETARIMSDTYENNTVIRVALAPSCIDYVIPLLEGAIKRVKEKYPNIEVQIREVRSGDGVQLLYDNEVDLALMSFAQEVPIELGHQYLFSSVLKACVNKEHPYAEAENITWKQLDEQPLILSEPMKTVLQTLAATGTLRKYGITFNYKFVFSQRNTLERLIEKNYGIGIAAPGIFIPKSDKIKMINIEEKVPFNLGIFWNKKVVMKDEVLQLRNLIGSKTFIKKIQEKYENF